MFGLRLALPVAGGIEGFVGKDEAAGEMISASSYRWWFDLSLNKGACLWTVVKAWPCKS